MEICYYRAPKLNFGDDLNAVIWPQVMSDAFQKNPSVTLVGIGSILNEAVAGKCNTSEHTVIVLGSGTSYGKPPRNLDQMHVLAVRGPLTASLIGRPQAAVTDSAILLAKVHSVTKQPRKDRILFMPHHRTIFSTPWESIADECGMTYVSPEQRVDRILEHYSHAKLVVTEAMHGAIVADTLRIPWIPVAISPAVEEFKWRDWCMSMQLEFSPQKVQSGTFRDHGRFSVMEKVLRQAGINSFQNIPQDPTAAVLRSYLDRRFAPEVAEVHRYRPAWIAHALNHGLAVADGIHKKNAVRTLKAAAESRPLLSDESIYGSRLQQMLDAVGKAEALAAKL